MQAIETKWIGPTNTRGSRIIASCQAGKITVPWSYDLGIDDNHRAAARKLIKKLGWLGTWASGAIASRPNSLVHVSVRREHGPYECWDVWNEAVA